jgi:hypothetical protein
MPYEIVDHWQPRPEDDGHTHCQCCGVIICQGDPCVVHYGEYVSSAFCLWCYENHLKDLMQDRLWLKEGEGEKTVITPELPPFRVGGRQFLRVEVYKRWDLMHNRGVGPLTAEEPLPPRYAIAYYDYLGRLYRVEERIMVRGGGGAPPVEHLFIYDYFCDRRGRILQRRIMSGVVVLTGFWGEEEMEMVDYRYRGDRAFLTKWHMGTGTCWHRQVPVSEVGSGLAHSRRKRSSSKRALKKKRSRGKTKE